MMKKMVMGGAAFLVMAVMCVSSAYAVPYVPGGYNGVFFNNAEVVIDNGGDPYKIEIGDQFWGVLQIQNVRFAGEDSSGQTGDDHWVFGGGLGGPVEMTGYFASEIVDIKEDYFGPGFDLIVHGPTIDPNGILNPGETFQFYEDSVFNYSTANQAIGLATATDGTPTWTLGLNASDDSPGGYWYSAASKYIPTGGPIGTNYGGLNFIDPVLQAQMRAITDPNILLTSMPPVELWFNSEVFVLNSPLDDVNFHIGSNDPAVFYVPEPGTLVLLGFGLLGLLGYRRRRKI